MKLFADEEISAALERIFAADTFKSAPKLKQFLRYIVAQKLDGKADQLKAYSIAIDAFNYPADFDPQSDPIIRVQARRLRTALKEYYLDTGSDERIRISVPRGGYRPKFSENSNLDNEDQPKLNTPNVEIFKGPYQRYILPGLMVLLLIIGLGIISIFWEQEPSYTAGRGVDTITIAMRQDIQNPSEIKDREDATYFSQELRSAIARNSALSIILPAKSTSEENEIATGENELGDNTDFIIHSSILGTGFSRNVSVELLNGQTNKLLWSKSYKLSDIEDETITQIVRGLNSEIFRASIQALESKNPKTLSAPQLVLLATWASGPARSTLAGEKERITLARLAIKRNPNFGPAYSVLAEKLAFLATVDGASATEEAAIEAKNSAARVLELSAGDENALFNVALYYWFSGQANNSIAMMKRVTELNPSHGFANFFSMLIPYTCSAAPADVLNAAIEFDRSLGADNPARGVTMVSLSWLHLNRGELAEALEVAEYASQMYQNPHTLIQHAAILDQLGRSQEAAELLLSQKANWPSLSVEYFLDNTLPRVCSKLEKSENVIDLYVHLEQSMKGLPSR